MKMSLKLAVVAIAAAVCVFPEKSSAANYVPINHYTTIGMPPMTSGDQGRDGVDEMIEASKNILRDEKNCYRVPIAAANHKDEDCHYVLYSSKSGAQLWGGVKGQEFMGFDPHFKGKCRQMVYLLGRRQCRDDDDFFGGLCSAVWDYPKSGLDEFFSDESNYVESDGVTKSMALYKGVVKNRDDDKIIASGMGFMDPKTRSIYCAFDFKCPNFACIPADLKLPAKATLQLTAFAENEWSTYESVEEYNRSVKDKKNPCASKYFGSAEFAAINNPDWVDRGKDYALIIGHVIEVEKRTNELTGRSFYSAVIETAGDVQFDLVIDERLPDRMGVQPPKVGGVIEGWFWLTGFIYVEDTSDDAIVLETMVE